MLFLPALFLLSAVLCGATPTYERKDLFTGETLLCAKCPPGTHMAAHCTATKPTECAPCRGNHFTELWNYLPRCLYCNNLCTGNQEVEKECSPVTNRVCRCKKGFYWADGFCMEHSRCGSGYGVQTEGTPQLNTVCERCSDGYFSNSSSALESCVKQQECANGQTVLLPGSVYRDTVCGTCQDLANGGDVLRTFLSGFFSMRKMHVLKVRKLVARYIHNSGEERRSTVPKQRGRLLHETRAWLDQAPVEQLKELLQKLKDLQLNSMPEKLEKRLREIEQQTTNCSLTL